MAPCSLCPCNGASQGTSFGVAACTQLHWMYNAEVDINERTYNGLLDVAHKFEVSCLSLPLLSHVGTRG